MTHSTNFTEDLAAKELTTIDLLLLEISPDFIPDRSCLSWIEKYCNELPIVVVSDRDDRQLGLALIRTGVQDFLIKSRLDSSQFANALLYAFERYQTYKTLCNDRFAIAIPDLQNADLQQHRLEKELHQDQQLLDSFIRNAPFGITILDRELRYVRINENLAEINEVPLEAHLGKTVWEVIPDLAPKLAGICQQILETGKPILEVEISRSTQKNPDEERTWLASYFPLLSDKNQPLAVGIFVIEITARKRAEAALKESEERFRAIFENAAIGIAQVWPDGQFLKVNAGFCNIVRYSKSQLRVRTFESITHPEDLESYHSYSHQLLAGKIQHYSLEKRFVCPSGEWVWTNTTVSLVRSASGEPKYFVKIIEDISDRKQLEAQLIKERDFNRLLIEACPAFLVTWDATGKILLMNPSMLKATGYTLEEVMGADYLEMFVPEAERINLCESIERSRLLRQPGFHIHRVRTKGGQELLVEWQAQLVFKEASEDSCLMSPGAPLDFIIAVGSDITERRAAQAALIRVKAAVESASDAIGITDLEGRSIYHNRAFVQQYGYTVEELNDLGGPGVMYVQPAILVKIFKTIRKGKSWSGEVELLTKIGDRVLTLVRADCIKDESQNIIGLVGVITDITERKQAEIALKHQLLQQQLAGTILERIRSSLNLENVLNNAVQEVRNFLQTDRTVIYRFHSDWSGTISVESVADGWMPLIGMNINDECFAPTYAVLYQQGRVRAIDDIDRCDLQDCHKDLLRQLQVKANLVVPILQGNNLWGLLIAHHCSGTRIWLLSELELLRQLSLQLAIAIQQSTLFEQAKTEIAERKQAEAALRESEARERSKAAELEVAIRKLRNTQTQLVQQEKMAGLGQMIAGIAHEINNPVNFIYGNISYANQYANHLFGLLALYQQYYPNPANEIVREIESIELDFITDDFKKLLASIQEGAERIRDIVLSLRNFSRLDEADMKPADLHSGIESTLLILQHRLKEQNNRPSIQIVKDFCKLPLVECYPGQLNQVFMNILANAIDALEDKMKKNFDFIPQILIRTELEAELGCTIVRIVDNGPGIPPDKKQRIFDPFFTTKPVGLGTGLGLSICYQIVTEKHQGTLNFHSRINEGTEFIIEIPLRRSLRSSESSCDPSSGS